MREICVGNLERGAFQIARPRVQRQLAGWKERGFEFGLDQ